MRAEAAATFARILDPTGFVPEDRERNTGAAPRAEPPAPSTDVAADQGDRQEADESAA